MVIGTPSRNDRSLGSDHRGQLLLVGAVAISLVIVMLALVVNTVLFTQNAGGERVSAEVDGVEEFTFEAAKTSRSVLLRVNHQARNRTASELLTDTTLAVGNYSDALARSYATARTVSVDVSYVETTRNGTRIIQPTDRNYTEPSSKASTWDVIPLSDETNIGWYLLNVDLVNTSANHGKISVTGDNSNTIDYYLNRSDGGNGNNLTIIANSPGGYETEKCQATGGRVLVDLLDGEGSFGRCSFAGIDEQLEPPYRVRIDGGNRIRGKYAIVTKAEWPHSIGPAGNEFDACPSGEVCKTPAVWNGTVDLSYHSRTLQYEQQRNISVYEGPS